DEQDIALAFEPFVQLSGSGRAQEGTGLGLSLTRTFAELHGGTLELESRLGEGTTVTVRIPAHRVVL
ncbi:MAG: ATP-binding protein, partial [Alphaproteobacteria bacterium]